MSSRRRRDPAAITSPLLKQPLPFNASCHPDARRDPVAIPFSFADSTLALEDLWDFSCRRNDRWGGLLNPLNPLNLNLNMSICVIIFTSKKTNSEEETTHFSKKKMLYSLNNIIISQYDIGK